MPIPTEESLIRAAPMPPKYAAVNALTREQIDWIVSKARSREYMRVVTRQLGSYGRIEFYRRHTYEPSKENGHPQVCRLPLSGAPRRFPASILRVNTASREGGL